MIGFRWSPNLSLMGSLNGNCTSKFIPFLGNRIVFGSSALVIIGCETGGMFVVGVEGKGQEIDFQAFVPCTLEWRGCSSLKQEHTNWETRASTSRGSCGYLDGFQKLSSRVPHGVISSLIIKIIRLLILKDEVDTLFPIPSTKCS